MVLCKLLALSWFWPPALLIWFFSCTTEAAPRRFGYIGDWSGVSLPLCTTLRFMVFLPVSNSFVFLEPMVWSILLNLILSFLIIVSFLFLGLIVNGDWLLFVFRLLFFLSPSPSCNLTTYYFIDWLSWVSFTKAQRDKYRGVHLQLTESSYFIINKFAPSTAYESIFPLSLGW